MGAIWLDSCDFYPDASGATAVERLERLGYVVTGTDINSYDSGGYLGNGCFGVGQNSKVEVVSMGDSQARAVVSVYFYATNFLTLTNVFNILDAVGSGVSVALYGSSGVAIYDTTGLVENLGVNLWNLLTWNHIEIQHDFGVAQNLTVKINGTEVFNDTVTSETGGGALDTIQLLGSTASGQEVRFDDFIIGVGPSGAFSSLEGAKRLITLLPDGDSVNDATSFQPSIGSSYYEMVNDLVPGGGDGDTTYVNFDDANAVDDEDCLYTFENLPAGVTGIVGVCMMHELRNTHPDGPSIWDVYSTLSSNGTDEEYYLSSPSFADTDWHIRGHEYFMDDEPDTGPWSAADIDAIVAGLRVGDAIIPPLDPSLGTNVIWAGRGDNYFENPVGQAQRWNNRVSGGSENIDGHPNGAVFHPFIITRNVNGLGVKEGVQFATSSSTAKGWADINEWLNLVQATRWHVMMLLHVQACSVNDPQDYYNETLLAQSNISSGGWLTNWCMNLRNHPVDGPSVQVYVDNGAGGVSVHHAVFPVAPPEVVLIEWWADGTDHHVRVNNGTISTDALPAGGAASRANNYIKWSSINFQGNTSNTQNEMYELAIADDVIPEALNLRSHFNQRYGVPV